jgi:hypothetical protein
LLFNRKIFLAFILPSCSFSPLYKNSLLSEVSFVEPNKSNEDLHNIYMKLRRLFFTNTSSKNIYIVTLSLEKRYDDIDIREDEKVTRMGVSNKVTFYLKDKETEDILFVGESIISSAFNRVAEPYANDIAKKDTEERLATSVAQDIRNQIILFSNKINQ